MSTKNDSMPRLIPSSEDVLAVLTKTGAFRHGHFVYPSGEHTPHYFQMPLALRHYQVARELGVAVYRERILIRECDHRALRRLPLD